MTATCEAELLTRVLSALLREDVVGLRTRSSLVERPDGRWLRLPTDGDSLLLPVAEDGFQCEYAARLPLLVRESDGAELTSYDTVLTALRALADPVDRAGYDAFAEECRQTLDTMRLHAATPVGFGADSAHWPPLAYDTLAARLDHPVYPTARGRAGLTDAQLLAYAPEFHPGSPCAGWHCPASPSPSPARSRSSGPVAPNSGCPQEREPISRRRCTR